jgi:hypothetical protein
MELRNQDSFDGSIGAGNTETLEFPSCQPAEVAQVMIDGGSSGTSPSSYDYTVELYSSPLNEWMQVDSGTGLTTFTPPAPDPFGEGYRINVTNPDTSQHSYRISLELYEL